MSGVKSTDNLNTFLASDETFMFGKTSDLRVLPEHNCSVVFPCSLNTSTQSIDVRTTIVTGQVRFIEYVAGKEHNPTIDFKNTVNIHGVEYPLSGDAKTLHEAGMAASKRYTSGSKKPSVLGAEPDSCPVRLYVESVHVKLDAKSFGGALNLSSAKMLIDEINAITGRNISYVAVGDSFVFVVPITWILQDHTAIAEMDKKDPSKSSAIIKKPVVFPTLNSKIIFLRKGVEHHGIIVDFDILENGTSVEVRVRDHKTGEYSFLPYSDVYATSIKSAFNPAIQKQITPAEYEKLKGSYLEHAREYVFGQLSKWGRWRVCGPKDKTTSGTSELVALTMTFAENANGRKKKESAAVWIRPADLVTREDLNAVSFVSGKVEIDGKTKEVVYKGHIDADDENSIYLHDIPEGVQFTSLRLNAVQGRVKSMVDGASISCFFSTKNMKKLNVDSMPFLGPSDFVPPNRPSIDVIGLEYVLGYKTKSKENGYTEQVVVNFVETTRPLLNFHLWIVSRGSHKMFLDEKTNKPKTASVLAEMFKCTTYPELIEIFNFLIHGYTAQNPTRDSEWTQFFMTTCLGLELADI
jgi:hypothetical protein